MLFDWLIIGQVLAVNPAHAVRGPKHIVKRGKTPVLTEGLADDRCIDQPPSKKALHAAPLQGPGATLIRSSFDLELASMRTLGAGAKRLTPTSVF